MKATATLAPVWPARPAVTIRHQPGRAAGHPITRDPAALEWALVTLFEAAKAHAVSVGTLPEHDVQTASFRRQEGALAATLANPVQESLATAADLLFAHGIRLLGEREFAVVAERVRAQISHSSRYAADSRPRH